MMHDNFGEVIDEKITALNIRRGSVFRGRRLGKLSPDSTYAELNLFPIIGARPTFDSATQTISGPTYEWDVDKQIINKVYTVSEKTEEMLAAESLKSFEQFKAEKQTEMEAVWDAGVVTSVNDIHMQAGKVDQDKLAAGLVSQQNKINIGKATLFDTVTVRDINNVNHEVTIQDFMVIVADVAEYVENLQYEYWAAIDNWSMEPEPEEI